MYRIGVVILNYNTWLETKLLVNNLMNQTLFEECLIVIVDNASPKGCYVKLQNEFRNNENVTVISNSDNYGYAIGNNVGLRWLSWNTSVEHMMVLNSDVFLHENSIEKLLDYYSFLPNAGLIAPLQVKTNGEPVHLFRHNTFLEDCISLFTIGRLFLGAYKRYNVLIADKDYLEVEVIAGSFLFASTDYWKSIDFFDERTFLYGEERFLYYKSKLLGYKNYVLLKETYIHSQSCSINAAFNETKKFRILCESVHAFTKYCRINGGIKALFYSVCIPFGILDLILFTKIRRFNNMLK